MDAGEGCARPGFGREVGTKRAGLDVERGQADAADGDAVTSLKFRGGAFGRDGDAAVFAALLDARDASYFFDDAGEHEASGERNIVTADVSCPTSDFRGVRFGR